MEIPKLLRDAFRMSIPDIGKGVHKVLSDERVGQSRGQGRNGNRGPCYSNNQYINMPPYDLVFRHFPAFFAARAFDAV